MPLILLMFFEHVLHGNVRAVPKEIEQTTSEHAQMKLDKLSEDHENLNLCQFIFTILQHPCYINVYTDIHDIVDVHYHEYDCDMDYSMYHL